MSPLSRLAIIAICLLIPVQAWAQGTTIRVVDQFGDEIAGSAVRIGGVDVPTSGVTALQGSQSCTIYPGLFEQGQESILYRQDVCNLTSGETLNLEWKTSDVTFALRDQSGVLIPLTQYRLLGKYFSHGDIAALPSVATLPITDEGAYPTLGGNALDGYSFAVYPGIHDYRQESLLWRAEGPFEVGAGVNHYESQWIMADVTFELLDQSGNPVRLTQYRLASRYFTHGDIEALPSVARLPITDEGVYERLGGNALDGYSFAVYPGINYYRQESLLWRAEGPFEVGVGANHYQSQWIMADVTFELLDQDENLIPLTQYRLASQYFTHGDIDALTSVARLPITDEGVYERLGGNALDGYSFAVYPGINYYRQESQLWRAEGPFEVGVGPNHYQSQWIMADVTFELLDQDENLIPLTQYRLASQYFSHGDIDALASVARLPITDEGVYERMNGRVMDGYPLSIHPGILGVRQEHSLIRSEDSFEVGSGENVFRSHWAQYSCAIEILKGGSEVTGGTLRTPWKTFSVGEVLTLPVTTPAEVSGGYYADGYRLTLNADGNEETRTTEISIEGLEDDSFVIEGVEYVVACKGNERPTAIVSEYAPLECTDATGTEVLLDGTASSDPDDDALSYTWLDQSGVTLSTEATPTLSLPLGSHTITLVVEDDQGASDSAETTVTVEDTTPPVITFASTGLTLWPPNHKYHTVDLASIATVTDQCDAAVSLAELAVTRVTSDEPEDARGGGDGKTVNDMVVGPTCQSVDIRAERQGGGDGRVYTIFAGLSDESGNTATGAYTIGVPHSRKSTAVDSGEAYAVDASCHLAGKGGPGLEPEPFPTDFTLGNYPNPFNPVTTIHYALPEESQVRLEVFDMTGRRIALLVDGMRQAGTHEVRFGHHGLSSGLYLYRMEAGNKAMTGHMVLMK